MQDAQGDITVWFTAQDEKEAESILGEIQTLIKKHPSVRATSTICWDFDIDEGEEHGN